MKVNETAFDQPDVSRITPEVDISLGRSDNHKVVIINDYGRYESVWLYWNDIDKQWKYTNGEPCNHETVRIEE